MKNRLIAVFTLIGALMLVLSSSTRSQGVIEIYLSYKIILSPADGSRPLNGIGSVANAEIDTAVATMNRLYATYFRGYRFQLVELIEVGGQGDNTGPSKWFNTNFFDPDNGSDWKNEMEDAAKNDSRYAWKENTINIYINNGTPGGICSFPGEEIIIIGGGSAANGPLHLHEIGHYFELCHTQGCSCGSCQSGQSGECNTTPGDDEIDDTLPDLACWNQNNIANWSFGTNYGNLAANQQNLVDDVFFNVMSYHGNASRLTERQLDKWADIANTNRNDMVSGRSIFVATNGGGLFATGSPLRPYRTVEDGVDDANQSGGDIVMLRPGAYNEVITIRKPVTLRATRVGPVAIGTAVFATSIASAETAVPSHPPLPGEKDAVVGNMAKEAFQALPHEYALRQNFPNPFNPETMIYYDLPENSEVRLVIHDMLGRSIRTLVDTEQKAGYHQVLWDGRDNDGRRVASGVYFYTLKAAEFRQTRKMILLP